MPFVGVLSLQGDFDKHLAMLSSLGCDARPFKEVRDIPELTGLVIPGGESTTIGMLMERRGLVEPLRMAIAYGLPVFGTCAGAILLAKEIEDSSQLTLGAMDMRVKRNAYGRQVDSFEARLDFHDAEHGIDSELEGVFIRAPRIESAGPLLSTLSEFNRNPVLVRQGRLLAATFHPELTSNPAVHAYFLRYLCGLTVGEAG
jgi:5'-phosphate synthase pdxT subunit